MKKNVYDVLTERGILKQASHPEEIKELLEKESVTFYIGFDPTADSLHIGHYVPLVVMAHMQHAGHKPIALLGGGTAMIGDPSGKSDMRRMLTTQELDQNAANFKAQMSRILDFSDDKAILVNNGDWNRSLNFLDFMRDIGVHFSVNHMLAAECYKQRLEGGLSFFEMSYMLMQSYDFLELNRKYNCTIQVGGDDQWSNMLGGMDLIRKKERKNAYCFTTALLTTKEGKKMGKTEKGALWLDKNKCPVFDFYQYWRNVDDADVKMCLSMLTFLPMEQINELCSVTGSALNEAKSVLAFTLTEQVHGTEEAQKAQEAARALFSGGGDISNMPTLSLTDSDIDETGLRVVDLLCMGKLCKSKSDARRMIEDGAVSVDDVKVESVTETIAESKLSDGVIIKKGKKGFVRVLKG
jgi:tyrosyl-tRNA synthetase